MSTQQLPLGVRLPRRRLLVAGLGVALLCSASYVFAASPPKAEVMVIHATKCSEKKVDPQITDPPPLGYECMAMLDKKTLTLVVNQGSTMKLPNGRTFQLVHTGMGEAGKYKVTASIDPSDGGAGFVKLADIAADPNTSFNVGGFTHQGGVLLLSVKIVP